MAVVLEIIDLLVCRKIHGCGCFADDPAPRESKQEARKKSGSIYGTIAVNLLIRCDKLSRLIKSFPAIPSMLPLRWYS